MCLRLKKNKKKLLSISPPITPTMNTQSHPDHASWPLLIQSHTLSCFFLMMCRCRIRSLATSRCQSMVWKSSYCPIPVNSCSSDSMWKVPLVTPGGEMKTSFTNWLNHFPRSCIIHTDSASE